MNSVQARTGDRAGPGHLSGYSNGYVEKEEDVLNVDAYKSEVGGIMPSFRLSSLSLSLASDDNPRTERASIFLSSIHYTIWICFYK